jgi:hypothetical protein
MVRMIARYTVQLVIITYLLNTTLIRCGLHANLFHCITNMLWHTSHCHANNMAYQTVGCQMKRKPLSFRLLLSTHPLWNKLTCISWVGTDSCRVADSNVARAFARPTAKEMSLACQSCVPLESSRRRAAKATRFEIIHEVNITFQAHD